MSIKDKMSNKVIDFVYYMELILLTIFVLAYICNHIFFCDWQQIKVQYYLKTDKINELTIEECKEIFGEPIYVNNKGNIFFEGGSKCSGGFIFIYYEYILYVKPTHDGIGVEYADTDMIYERIY